MGPIIKFLNLVFFLKILNLKRFFKKILSVGVEVIVCRELSWEGFFIIYDHFRITQTGYLVLIVKSLSYLEVVLG